MENALTFTVLVLAICLVAVAVTLNEKINQLTKRHDQEMSAVSKEITRLIRLLNTTREQLAAVESAIDEQTDGSASTELGAEELETEKLERRPLEVQPGTPMTPSAAIASALHTPLEIQSAKKTARAQPVEDPSIVAEKLKQRADEERARKAKKAKRLQAALAKRGLGETEYFVFFLKRAYKIRAIEAENLCLKLEAHGQARSEPHFKLDYIKNEIFRRWSGADEELEQLGIWLDKIKAKADLWESRQAGFAGLNSAPRIEALEARQNNRYGD